MKKALCLVLALMLCLPSVVAFADIEGTVQGDIMLTSTEGEALPEDKETATETSDALKFSDIIADSVLGEAVYKLVDAKVISGYPDGTFRPDSGVTRAELCKMINLVYDLDVKATSMSFKDVTEEDWYYDYVLVAVQAGYIKGFTDNTFRGDDPVTREQACAIINRVTTAKGASLFDLPFADNITDAVSDWALEDVKKIIANYVMPLEAGGKFRATEDITRGELALALEGFVVIVPEYTVTFETNGGSEIASVVVKEGKKVSKPEDPKKDNYTFNGWYTDSKLKTAYDFEKTVSDNITLYAKWQAKVTGGGGVYIPPSGGTPSSYTVTFNSKGGSAVDSVTVTSGATISAPAEPTKEMKVFTGWYTDSACTNLFDFTTPITGSITLYAGWEDDHAAMNGQKISDLTIFKEALVATTFDIQPHTDMASIIVSTFESVISDGESGIVLTNDYIKTTYEANMLQIKDIWENQLFVDTFSDEQQDFKDKIALVLTDAQANGYSMSLSETYVLFRAIIGDFINWE